MTVGIEEHNGVLARAYRKSVQEAMEYRRAWEEMYLLETSPPAHGTPEWEARDALMNKAYEFLVRG